MRSRPRVGMIFGCAAVLWGICARGEAANGEDPARRILVQRCLNCHAAGIKKGGLDLSTRAGAIAGGDSGPAVEPGQPDDSLLWERITAGEMPPKKPLSPDEQSILRSWIESGAPTLGEPLEPPRAGPDWWSLQAIRDQAPPMVGSVKRHADTAIDAFVLAQLAREGLELSPEADRRSLVRRVSLDLAGLPPRPEEVEAFVRDTRPTAYARLLDRLLASPGYGERMARHWLDVARFAESHGYETNALRMTAWPYRDWVIRAMNADLPFARFVREQFAGDGEPGADTLTRAATGFLVGGTHDVVGNQTEAGSRQQRADDLDDVITATGVAFLGLSINCARCHDHKFDPISQRDYYAMAAVFSGLSHAEREIPAMDREVRRRKRAELEPKLSALLLERDAAEPLTGPGADRSVRPAVDSRRTVERFLPITARVVRFTAEATTDGLEPCLDELEFFGADLSRNLAIAGPGVTTRASTTYPNSSIHRLEHLNDGKFGNSRSWISAEPGAGWVEIELGEPATIERIVWARDREGAFRDRQAKTYRIEVASDRSGPWTEVASSADRAAPGTAVSSAVGELDRQVAALREELAGLSDTIRVYAGAFETRPPPAYILERGDPMRRSHAVSPGMPGHVRPRLDLAPEATDLERRRGLARFIAHEANPLAARVAVNRIWLAHFGRGIVATPGDFGFQGERPSHPELLDWLAARFHEDDGRAKPIHRRIVQSAAYRQANAVQSQGIERDAENQHIWRYASRRLEAEVLRDAMLECAGRLDRHMGGPGYTLWEPNTNYVVVFTPLVDPGPSSWRRMIYQFKPRSQPDPVFGAFDCPDGALVSPRRNRSTTALQALNLWNSAFVLSQCEGLTERVTREAGADARAQVDRAFQLVLSRSPAPGEAELAAELVRNHGAKALARVLFNSNEFVYTP